MTDRIELRNMRFQGRHGWHPHEQVTPQPWEVDLELHLDLGRAGAADDLEATVDYGPVFRLVREIVETRSYRLLEAMATTIANEVLSSQPLVDEVVVRVRKPAVQLGGPLDWAGLEIRRRR